MLAALPGFLIFATPQDIDFSKAFDLAAQRIRTMYYAREARGPEMDSLLKKYEPMAKGAKTKAQFSEVVNHMIADFKDSHFALLTDEDQGFYSFGALAGGTPKQMPNVGAWFRKNADGYTVQMVMNGGPAELSDLRKGDRMISVNDKPFSPVTALASLVDSKAQFKILRGKTILEKGIDVVSTTAPEMFLSGTKLSARIIESGSKKIGYVHLWTMSSEDQKKALEGLVYGKFSKTDAFILDIRDGFGGRPEGYGDPFFRPEANIEWRMGSGMGQKQLFGYGRPLVLITNEGSRSAKEVFSYLMKKSHRATLVGSTTAGHVLGTTPMKLTEWAYIEIPIVDVITDGFRIEGTGIAPDIAVSKEFDENGKDLFLQRAVEVLK